VFGFPDTRQVLKLETTHSTHLRGNMWRSANYIWHNSLAIHYELYNQPWTM